MKPDRFQRELDSFPKRKHDDMVDAMRFTILPQRFRRIHLLVALLIAAAISIFFLFIGRAIGTTKTLVVTKLPESLMCQPFRTKEDHAEQIKRIKQSGAQEIMFQMLGAAYEAQSRGEGQVISFSNYACAEKLGHMQSVRASTYYFVKK